MGGNGEDGEEEDGTKDDDEDSGSLGKI